MKAYRRERGGAAAGGERARGESGVARVISPILPRKEKEYDAFITAVFLFLLFLKVNVVFSIKSQGLKLSL